MQMIQDMGVMIINGNLINTVGMIRSDMNGFLFVWKLLECSSFACPSQNQNDLVCHYRICC
uniref:Uncharacterized protein n=1 Tax=Anguilla anguilla TaxID=7936 RepID=A0A0E9VLD7_ANGAN